MKLISFLITFFIFLLNTFSQIFIKVTADDNDLADAPGAIANTYTGCAWIDYDNDGWLDMFWVQRGLYHNTGVSFEKNTDADIAVTSGIGTSWSDYNNDGFIDCFIAGGGTNGSSLYKNKGDGTFTKITSGPLTPATGLRAWACAWGDIDNDSYTDIVLAAPFGFAGIDDENKFLLNKGDGTFEKLDTILITQGTAPYTIATWSDYDMDG
ncbi:MAG: VCBS repeat-containing protein, partial [Chitinophagales bacterium]|nr:VCBS repeat-containing protein [Chitinophagales bacterium]